MSTQHVDKVYGWIVVILGFTIQICILTSAFARNLSPIAQNQLLTVAVACVAGLTGALSLRKGGATDSQQQVTIPSADPAAPPITVSSGSPVAPPPQS